ncbi:MAG: hypothetical protein HUN04_22585 [Desulfobacter sp.]|nr:MAG: hypothetical protein HUN04_22585 [Desulfobacter sp.]
MSDINENTPLRNHNRKMTRREIIKAVTESGEEEVKKKKLLVIPSLNEEKVDFKQIAQGLNVEPDSTRYNILKILCEGKSVTLIDIKVLIQRMEDLNAEQLGILKVICQEKGFTAKNILNAVLPIKKFGKERLLILRAFVDLKGGGPGPLNRFFTAALPQGNPKELGKEGYEKELQEKLIRPDQATVFYNICYGVKETTPSTAIQALPKIRQLRPQHTQFLNTFLKEYSVFGKKPINNDTILGLINLFLTLPEFQDVVRFRKFIKKLSSKPDDKKNDFQFLVHTFKTEIEAEKAAAGGGFAAGIKKIFS